MVVGLVAAALALAGSVTGALVLGGNDAEGPALAAPPATSTSPATPSLSPTSTPTTTPTPPHLLAHVRDTRAG